VRRSYRQWQVAIARLDPVEGSEQAGKRHVLIVSNDDFNQAIPMLTIIPLTTTRRSEYPSEVTLPAQVTGRECRALAHQIRTISQKRIDRVVGELSDEGLRARIIEAIIDHLGVELKA
jgi:mRNA interferase MazF